MPFIYILLISTAHAQKVNKAEAQRYLEKVWGYIKTSDSISFVNLWLPEDSVWQRIHTPIDGVNNMKSFHFLQEFLFAAIISSASIDHVSIGQQDARGTEISAIFKTKLHDIGFSFYVAPINGQWTARGKPGIMMMSK